MVDFNPEQDFDYFGNEDIDEEDVWGEFEGKTKDENIEMKPPDGDWEQTKDGFVKPREEETSLDDLPEAPDTSVSPELQEKVESFYKYLDDNRYIYMIKAHLCDIKLYLRWVLIKI